MKKTSVYLSEHEAAMLKRLAEETGKSQARVLREALAAYDEQSPAVRRFAIDGCAEGDGSSVADIPEEELMRGFGEDDRTPYLRRLRRQP